jgi:leader peptidase (prepilin peptidase)/N-methyltransferase
MRRYNNLPSDRVANSVIEFLQHSPALFVLTAGLLGLVVGSFLNVVIYRLPVMMENEWRGECAALETNEPPEATETFNLMLPRSRCPHCSHAITAFENIPIVSYIILGGKCRGCKQKISLRYPLLELTSGLISVAVASHFGLSAAGLSALILSWALLVLAMIDFDTQLLPDSITLPLLWAGIVVNYTGTFVSLEESVLGAIFGYLSLWLVFWGFKLATGKDGMGYGDFKLLAVLGAWFGWHLLPLIVVLSSVVGAIIGISMMVFTSHDKAKPIPFGPYLAIAGWIAMLWGDEIMQRYLHGGNAL